MTFEEFVALRLPALLRQATVLAGDRYVAEDVVQDVLIKAQPRWARIGALDMPDLYVRRMIINELTTVRRRVAARLRRERAQRAGRLTHVEDRADQVVQREALIALIRGLPARQRIVIALRYLEDMADADIAELLGCSPITVRTQASRALATLRGAATMEPLREQR